jgi:malonyl-CoA/methylmalonyl-CoA synthetase
MPEPATTPPLIARAETQRERTAIVAPEGTFTYGDLLDASARVAASLLAGRADLGETRVAFLVPPGFQHVAIQWGIWRAGGVAVPLGVAYPPPELEHVVHDAGAEIVVGASEAATVLRPIASAARVRYLPTLEVLAARRLSPTGARFSAMMGASSGALPEVAESRRAMIVYTSGTAGRPKGVVTTHANLRAQIASLVEAWEWSADDRVLLVLPLSHVHGIVNVVASALWSGGVCEILPQFDAERTWEIVATGRVTLFMAVPTIYGRLIAAWDAASTERRQAMGDGCRKIRLMVSGSSALPAPTFARWREITGHALLERYGMTEFGMALSNPLHGERRPGSVGGPLPGVEVRLVADGGAPAQVGELGELEVRGPGVFLEYWGKPEATRAAFRDGWFRTGDTAVLEDGRYRILGRTSSDIIKSGGYKISALEIEDVLRTHPAIADCAVVGVAHGDWGEKICAVAELLPGRLLGLEELRAWAKDRLAPHKIPKDLQCLPALPRNAMGKVVKAEIAKLF